MAFETYLDHQVAPDGDTRRRLTALAAVTIFTASVGILAVVADRMRITRVTAPEGRAVIQDLNEAILPPPPPAPKVPGSDAKAAAPVEEDEPEPDEAPDDLTETIPEPRKAPAPTNSDVTPSSGIPGQAGPAVPGVPGGIGIPGAGPIAVPKIPVTPGTQPPAGPPKKVDFSALECRACPDPAQRDLQRAVAGVAKPLKTNRTKFCVGVDGRTTKVTTVGRTGSPQVDRICREAVKSWRFKPVRVDGKLRETCSSVSFDIQHER